MAHEWMDLPRYRLAEEDEDVDMDATAPAQFVLKLPKSFARRLAQPPPTSFTPPAPWTVDRVDAIEEPRSARAARERAGIIALFASVLAGVLVIGSVAVAAASAHGPIGIAHRVPKSLEHHVRASERVTGVTPRVHAATVSVESLARPRRAPRHRSRHHARR